MILSKLCKGSSEVNVQKVTYVREIFFFNLEFVQSVISCSQKEICICQKLKPVMAKASYMHCKIRKHFFFLQTVYVWTFTLMLISLAIRQMVSLQNIELKINPSFKFLQCLISALDDTKCIRISTETVGIKL